MVTPLYTLGTQNSEVIPEPAGRTFRYAAATLAAGAAGSLLMVATTLFLSRHATLHPALAVWIGLIPVQFGACGMAVLALVPGCRDLSGLRRCLGLDPGAAGLRAIASRAMSVAILVYPVTILLAALAAGIFLLCFGTPPTPSPLVQLLESKFSLSLYFSACAGTLLLAPVSEEILFRLVLHDGLREAGVPAPAFWTSMLFAGMHGVLHQAPGLFLLALVLQRCREHDGSLRLPIAVHMCYNAVGMALLGLGFLRG